jgi:cellulose synthase/poly-beta-1,6-N-acetylglucosamine synthase-like glycosyltransferase
VRLLAWLVSLLSLHSWLNGRLLRVPAAAEVAEGVSVLIPARDEAARIGACLRSLEGQGISEILVLDDGSTDSTAAVAAELGARVLTGAPVPTGWNGKTWACQQLADAASGDVLLFLDADVVLAPGAVGATVGMLDELDLVSPYPRQDASRATRLVQPLLQWSILTFLPLRLAESGPPSMSAANGQLLAIRRSWYDRAGGHAAVRGEVVEDVALLRAVKAAGGRGGVVDGTALATTRMYDDWPALVEGYTKSLHTLPAGVPVLLLVLYVLPFFSRRPAARIACAAGVLGRVATARRTGGRVVDSVTHPVSVIVLCGLWARSRLVRERTWKGRVL